MVRLTRIWSRVSRFSNELLETKQDQYLEIKILKKEKKQDIPNSDLANQEGSESIKMYEIEKIETPPCQSSPHINHSHI